MVGTKKFKQWVLEIHWMDYTSSYLWEESIQALCEFYQKRLGEGGRSNRQRYLWEDIFTKDKLFSLKFSLKFPLPWNHIILHYFINYFDVPLVTHLSTIYRFVVFLWQDSRIPSPLVHVPLRPHQKKGTNTFRIVWGLIGGFNKLCRKISSGEEKVAD